MALTSTRAAALAALVPAAVALGPVAPAASDDDDRRQHGSTETFEGTCEFSGTLRQNPPLTNTLQPGRAWAVATGRCTGTLTDSRGRVRQLDGARAGYSAQAEGTTSCGGGTAEGAGFILLRGERIGFRFSEVRGPGEGLIRLDGERGGSAAGTARVSEDEDPVRIAQECSGSGLRQVGIRIDLATTPSISG
jgi:hypothetical protein